MTLGSALSRPRRWSFTHICFAVVGIYFSSCWLFNMPVLSSKLPSYSGDYQVGVIDIEAPVEKRRIADVVFRNTHEPAFDLETVLFSLYYPAVKDVSTRRPYHPWVSKPVALTAEGYARLAHVSNALTNGVFTAGLWLLAGSTTIPAKVDVPIHDTLRTYPDYHEYNIERPLDEYGLPEFPVIIFSHGMASSRTSYTQYCAELASRGYVVAAIEHRDGSGPGTMIMKNQTEQRALFPMNTESLDPTPEMGDFKTMQLAMRQAEVEETVKVLYTINRGSGRDVYKSNPRMEGVNLGHWEGRLNMKQIVIAGHSYGATLALQALKGAPSETLPFVGGIILDPGKHSGPLNDDINVPIVVVHSQSWSARHSIFQGRPHFSVVKDLVRKVVEEKKKFAWFTTAKGTTHPSVTDAPLIEPFILSWTTGSTIDAREGVLQYVKITRQFLHYLENGHRQSILQEDITHPEYDETAGIRPYNPKVAKYWQIHMAPPTKCPTIGYCGLDAMDGASPD